jgi:hypothetical protein
MTHMLDDRASLLSSDGDYLLQPAPPPAPRPWAEHAAVRAGFIACCLISVGLGLFLLSLLADCSTRYPPRLCA